MLKKGVCPKCNEIKQLTKHHIYPKRHFGKGRKNNKTIRICRSCHDDIERLIPFDEQPIAFYPHIVSVFLST